MAHKLLNAVSTIGASESVHLDKPTKDHTVEVSYTDVGGAITVLTIVLQASAQNKNTSDALASWYDLQTYTFTAGDITAKKAMFHVVNKPVERIRVNLTVATGIVAGDFVTVRYIQGGCCG